MRSGMNDYLSKPINRVAALACIARWTNNSQAQIVTSISTAKDESVPTDSTCDYVDETILQRLVRDTAAEIVPELLMFYIEDTQQRMELVNTAIIKQDLNTLEFEAHTIGSSAAAHGNARLHTQARNVEQLCKKNKHQQAIEQANKLPEIANESFRLLTQRAQQGFETIN